MVFARSVTAFAVDAGGGRVHLLGRQVGVPGGVAGKAMFSLRRTHPVRQGIVGIVDFILQPRGDVQAPGGLVPAHPALAVGAGIGHAHEGDPLPPGPHAPKQMHAVGFSCPGGHQVEGELPAGGPLDPISDLVAGVGELQGNRFQQLGNGAHSPQGQRVATLQLDLGNLPVALDALARTHKARFVRGQRPGGAHPETGCQGNDRKAAGAELPVQGSRPGLSPESWFADEHPYRISHGIKVDCPVFLLPERVLILVILFRQFQ